MGIEKPVILYDGFCNLCNGTINFVHKKDKNKLFQFMALQSDLGKKMIQDSNIPSNIDSVILIYQNNVFVKSDAIIEIARLLSFPRNIIAAGKFLPVTWRNKLYDFIALHRYKWFGKRDVCNLTANSD